MSPSAERPRAPTPPPRAAAASTHWLVSRPPTSTANAHSRRAPFNTANRAGSSQGDQGVRGEVQLSDLPDLPVDSRCTKIHALSPPTKQKGHPPAAGDGPLKSSSAGRLHHPLPAMWGLIRPIPLMLLIAMMINATTAATRRTQPKR